MRRPLEIGLRPGVAVMHEAGRHVAATGVDRLLQRIEHKVRAHRGRYAPAHDPPLDWFNTRRLLEPIGYVPPAEYEAAYDHQVNVPVLN